MDFHPRSAFAGLLALPLLLLPGLPLSEASPAAFSPSSPSASPAEPLRIGVVLDFTGALGEHGPIGKNAAELAVGQINAAGGVFGRPVELYFEDGETDPAATVAAARQLLGKNRVHAIVGAMGSAATLALARQVTIPAQVPTVSPTSTAPEISQLEDQDYVFRATYSDSAQGPVLAQLVQDEGYRAAAVVYRDDAYGRGLYQSFAASFRGKVQGLALKAEKKSYLSELRSLGSKKILVLLTYPLETEVLVRESLRHHIFQQFAFADSTRIADLMNRIDPIALEGVKGTSPALRDGEQPSTRAFLAAYEEAYGVVPTFGPGASVYDSVVCLALAAEKARSTAGASIRDALRPVCGGPGEEHIASAESLASALAAVRRGEAIDYQGAFSTVDWNAAGDVANGYVDVWSFSKGEIASTKLVPFDLGG